MGAQNPEHGTDDAYGEQQKEATAPEPVGIPGENTDDVPDDGSAPTGDAATEDVDALGEDLDAKRGDDQAAPGEYPADDPDLEGEDRFDAG